MTDKTVIQFATKLHLAAVLTQRICGAVINAFENQTIENLGKQIETKIEQAERDPNDAARSKIHQEALGLEKELASKTPEPTKAKSEPATVEPVTEKNFYEVICSVGTARMCFGKSFGELAGHGTKLATAKRNIEYLAKWFAEKPAATDDDKRSYAAYEFAKSSVGQREIAGSQDLGNKPPEPDPHQAEIEAANDHPPTPAPEFTIKDWKLVMVPFDVEFKDPAKNITEGDALGKLDKMQLKFLLVNRVNNPAKFDPKTKAELIFKAGLMLACEEKGIAA